MTTRCIYGGGGGGDLIHLTCESVQIKDGEYILMVGQDPVARFLVEAVSGIVRSDHYTGSFKPAPPVNRVQLQPIKERPTRVTRGSGGRRRCRPNRLTPSDRT